MEIKIALAGNPNSGKTTLFNALTGSNQFVGNWPGVTVEKKEGKLKKQEGVTITDLPGIYSLSPYTLEEVVARNYLVSERPNAIINVVDGTNLERNLYLTTQLLELGIPVIVAINLMDAVKKEGDKIDIKRLSSALGCKIVEISALKGQGLDELAREAVEIAKTGHTVPPHSFSGAVEHAIAHIEEAVVHSLPEEQQRWYAIKLFERDQKVIESLKISEQISAHIEADIVAAETELDDDAESIITNERYVYIAEVLKTCYKKKNAGKLSLSDKIDKVVTNRWLALPIFAIVMFIVYFISVTTVGTIATDWANDGVFGDGWHLLGIGHSQYTEADEEYAGAQATVYGFLENYDANGVDEGAVIDSLDTESETFDLATAQANLSAYVNALPSDATVTYIAVDEETLEEEEITATKAELEDALTILLAYSLSAPDPASYGVWVLGIPVLVENGLGAIGCWDWLQSLILDGIVAGVGAVLGFVPQIFVLFLLLALLEACGYMARIAFVLDRIFRKFGLSGKSFIPMLIGTGCGIPGVMASRTIENERDRRMTIMTTTFIPCGAKLPFIAMIAGAIFGGAWWVAPLAYFIGMAAIIISGIMLKKTKPFSGEPAPFVMELPAYRFPGVKNVLLSMWERGWSFIKKAGTIILLSTVVIWFFTYFGVVDGQFRMLGDDELSYSILAFIGNIFSWLFAPLGFGTWQATVASFTGLVAKENIVGTMAIFYGDKATIGAAFTQIAGLSFLIFNLLCAPCFAAMGAIRREMNNGKWTAFAITYQCVFAYAISFIVYQLGNLFTGGWADGVGILPLEIIGAVLAIALIGFMGYLLFRPAKKA
ncbi:MAG: ferrous iron transporter B [Clostridia bacterium]|nr:ferrous iron transporter B [Clostridia bacterium]